MDAVSNFAVAQLLTGIDADDTSMTVASGQGSRFPDPASGAYNLVIWDSLYNSAAEAYHAGAAEIVRATALSTDTFTITRAQESTSAVAHNVSGRTYNVELNATAKLFTDLNTQGPTTIYQAVLVQSSTSAPTATVIKNGFTGTMTLARSSAGVYTLTDDTAEFTSNKTAAIFQCRDGSDDPQATVAYATSTTIITFRTFSLDGWTGMLKVEVFS